MGRSTTPAKQEIAYLSRDEIITIHNETMERFGGGETGIFQQGPDWIDSILMRMKESHFGYIPFDTLTKKTAFMFQALLIYHPFVDGMKRTGIFSCIAFLLRNGYLFISKDVEDSIQFAISVADKSEEEDPDSSIETISNWIAERMISFSDNRSLQVMTE